MAALGADASTCENAGAEQTMITAAIQEWSDPLQCRREGEPNFIVGLSHEHAWVQDHRDSAATKMAATKILRALARLAYDDVRCAAALRQASAAAAARARLADLSRQ